MPEHRIERSSSDDEILGLEPEVERAPHPALSRAPDPSMAGDAAKPKPCVGCGYDLRGLTRAVCPECGRKIAVGRAAAAAVPSQSTWFDKKAVVLGVLGLAVGLIVTMAQYGALRGGLAFGIDFVITIAIGWGVFIACSIAWIGFDQPLRMTAVQLTGAYGAYAGAATLASLVPYMGWIVQLLAWVGLVVLLADLLDIEVKDSLIIALISAIIKIVLVSWVIGMLLA